MPVALRDNSWLRSSREIRLMLGNQVAEMVAGRDAERDDLRRRGAWFRGDDALICRIADVAPSYSYPLTWISPTAVAMIN
jgi:hypothetical protein